MLPIGKLGRKLRILTTHIKTINLKYLEGSAAHFAAARKAYMVGRNPVTPYKRMKKSAIL